MTKGPSQEVLACRHYKPDGYSIGQRRLKGESKTEGWRGLRGCRAKGFSNRREDSGADEIEDR